MPDFSSAQVDLAKARAERDAAVLEVARATARQRASEVAGERADRGLRPDDEKAPAERARLEQLSKQAASDAAAARDRVQRTDEDVSAARVAFSAFSDPRENLGRLDDRSPIALFPVRLETRFVTAPTVVPGSGGASGRESVSRSRGVTGGDGSVAGTRLLIRIYPDDCSIDTFEATISANELANTQRYWRQLWRAGGIEDEVRAAWRALVTAHGSGRAGWLIDNYQPLNLAESPRRSSPGDEMLVISTQNPLPAAEASALGAYWETVWRSAEDLAAQQQARATLEQALGTARADELVAAYRPYNLDDHRSPPVAGATASVAYVVFPPDPPVMPQSWSTAPQVKHFPDRFVVLGYLDGGLSAQAMGSPVKLPLHVGPDPTADAKTDPALTIHPDGDRLFVPDELRWMVDFEQAVKVGMGIAVDLTPEQASRGFDRLLVIGVQLSASDADGKAALEDLLHHHEVGRSGLSLVPQGTPTHNIRGAETGYSRLEDADQSFEDRKHRPLFASTGDPLQKRDGQWLAELLGIDPAVLSGVHGSGGQDQSHARAMQRALWPATIGYWMDKMLAPVFGDDTVESTRWFFTEFVSGRGPAPSIRIGGQPYGVLPTTAFSRIRWLDRQPRDRAQWADGRRSFLARLLRLLRSIDADFTAMKDGAAWVGKRGDAHQLLLDIVGLHPASVEYHSRYAESLEELYNTANLYGIGPDFWQSFVALGLEMAGAELLTRLGYMGSKQPDILQHFFLKDARLVSIVIDDKPLSETDPVRAYTGDGRNYIRWLIDAAQTSLEALRTEQGFTGDASPQALLYLYLRHALMLGYYDTSYLLHKSAGFMTEPQLLAMKPEPAFVHVAEEGSVSESRFSALYKAEPRITSNTSLLVSDYITENLVALLEARNLADQLAGLRVLADAPTAALERAFAEHVDTCSYRFDSWLLGLVNFQLQTMRTEGQDAGQPTPSGVYLGAYAWLEDLRPSTAQLQTPQLPADLQKTFDDPAPLSWDPANGGYIHGPSIPHARSAAVLRSGFLANATSATPQTMAVNLSSDRVRLALSVLEGIRNGQSLGALLGYRFERGLHDDHGLVEVDKFIYPLRKAFPLAADALQSTRTPPEVPIEAIEARNVLDGRKLIEAVRAPGVNKYPFGLTTLPSASATESDAINAQVSSMLDIYDAIADLALAEGVHQAVQGNFERIAATLDAYSTGHFPPEPEVVQTPPTGIGLSHRVALHLEPGLGPSPGATPRATAEPAVDAWLAKLLPDLDQIGCTVAYTDPITGANQALPVTLADLGLRPIDLLELIKPGAGQAMTELDDRVLMFVLLTAAPRPDAELKIQYMTAPAGKLSVFETAPLVAELSTLVHRSRPLRATDAMLHGDAKPDQDATMMVDRARIANPLSELDSLSTDIGQLLATLAPLLADPTAHRTTIVSGIDGFLQTAISLLERAARFGAPLSGWGFAYEWRHSAYVDLIGELRDLVARWEQRLVKFDGRLAAYDALPAATSDTERFKSLQTAQLLVAAALDPLPAAPSALRAELDAKRSAFAGRRDQFKALLTAALPKFDDVLVAAAALLPVSAFDAQPFALTAFEDRAIMLAGDLDRILTGHHSEIDARRSAAKAQLDLHDAASTAPKRVAALQAAAQAMFGDGFTLVPEFALGASHANEWANAVTAASSGTLLDYLLNTAKVDYPVEEWLCGAARVRPMLHAWETAVGFSEAFGRPAQELRPAQFPYQATASWVAMQFPPDPKVDSDRLCYTAHYSQPFDGNARQCGLLLDAWTEVIPGSDRDTGITFNFDRPDNEPPQAILLVTPAAASGTWQWDDLVAALHETLDLAKKRAVEPAQLDAGAYARFLPATIMAASLYGISITTVLAAANGAITKLQEVKLA